MAASRDFPAYRHRPGTTAHPRTHAQGHSYGHPEPTSEALTPENWRSHEAFGFGVELFNEGYWWESHEWWEAAWHATDDQTLRHLLQGLIQLAACWLKWEAGNDRGRRGLWRRSRLHLLAAAHSEPAVALGVKALVASLDVWFESCSIGPAAAGASPPHGLTLKT